MVSDSIQHSSLSGYPDPNRCTTNSDSEQQPMFDNSRGYWSDFPPAVAGYSNYDIDNSDSRILCNSDYLGLQKDLFSENEVAALFGSISNITGLGQEETLQLHTLQSPPITPAPFTNTSALRGSHKPTGLYFGSDPHFDQAGYRAPPRLQVSRPLSASFQQYSPSAPSESASLSHVPDFAHCHGLQTSNAITIPADTQNSPPKYASTTSVLKTSTPRKRPCEPNEDPSLLTKRHLTEEQKKENHLASEHRRRSTINNEYDALKSILPDGKKGESKSVVLLKAVEFIEALHREIAELKESLGYMF